MSEMVERVARAICKGRMIDPDSLMGHGEPSRVHGGYIIHDTMPAWRYFAGDADAAITAMRDPTDAMDAAGDETFDWTTSDTNGTWYPERADSTECWRAMIDAALK